MEGFTVVDGVVILVLAVSALLAFSRGFVREVLSIVGWVAAAVAAFVFAPQVEPLVREIPYVGEYLENCEIAMIAAFALVFAVSLIVVSIFTPLFANLIQRSALGPVDQGLGFLFGVARGILLIAIGLILYDNAFAGDEGIAAVDDSKTVELLEDAKLQLQEQIPTEAPEWINEYYERLIGACEA